MASEKEASECVRQYKVKTNGEKSTITRLQREQNSVIRGAILCSPTSPFQLNAIENNKNKCVVCVRLHLLSAEENQQEK